MSNVYLSKWTKFGQFWKIVFAFMQLAITILMMSLFQSKSNPILNFLSLAIVIISIGLYAMQFLFVRKKGTNLKYEAFLTTVLVYMSFFKVLISIYFVVLTYPGGDLGGLWALGLIIFIISNFGIIWGLISFFRGLKKIRKKKELVEKDELKNKKKAEKQKERENKQK